MVFSVLWDMSKICTVQNKPKTEQPLKKILGGKKICQIQRFHHSFRKSLNHNQLQTGKVLWEMSLCSCLLLVFFSKHWLRAMLDSTCTLSSSWSSHRVSVLFPYVYFVKFSRRLCIFHSNSVTLSRPT